MVAEISAPSEREVARKLREIITACNECAENFRRILDVPVRTHEEETGSPDSAKLGEVAEAVLKNAVGKRGQPVLKEFEDSLSALAHAAVLEASQLEKAGGEFA
jgi:hypothetical protein